MSDYTVYGQLPTLTEQQLNDLLAAKELPAVTAEDNGKVLTVQSGKWKKADPPVELPSVSSDDNGKVLTVAEGKWEKANPPIELPVVTAEDNGKVLKVVNGAWAAVLEE